MSFLETMAVPSHLTAPMTQVLEDSLAETDFHQPASQVRLTELGLTPEESLILLALYKSKVKYGYGLSPDTLLHILGAAKEAGEETALYRLTRAPFFLMKAGWVYEHAPYFILYGQHDLHGLDALIFEFASKYESLFLNVEVPTDSWARVAAPWRVLSTTFWERRIFHPLKIIEKTRQDRLEGVELSIDFHPFNYARLLPEEFSPLLREQIRTTCRRTGFKLDLHAPIVGPYAPSPNPAVGKQCFYNPLACLAVQQETVDLAQDIGAGAVVVHFINPQRIEDLARLVERAAGSSVRVTLENYCQTGSRQCANDYLGAMDAVLACLSPEVARRNFGLTLDVGHFNIEGDDPLVAARRVGRWCLDKGVCLRVHATDNYGDLLFTPPAFSADVHSNVSGRGINNQKIIELLRSMGLTFDVVAEQIQPLTTEDITAIHSAQTHSFKLGYQALVARGRQALESIRLDAFLGPEIIDEEAYQFFVGLTDVPALREYLVFRKIQDKKHLSVDEAKRISQDFMKMPKKFRVDLTSYIDDLLLPLQSDSGAIAKSELDLICQNVDAGLFNTTANEQMEQIFVEERVFNTGDIICRQNTPGREMYYIKEGEVSVHIDDSLVACLKIGEIFGEMSLFYNINRSATIMAARDRTRVGVLSREGLEHLFRARRPYAEDLVLRLYHILPQRLRNLNDKYKTIIRALNILYEGNLLKMPDIDSPIEMEIQVGEPDFLAVFNQDEIMAIQEKVRDFGAGRRIFSEGDAGDGAYFILDGKLRATAMSPDGIKIILGELGEGAIFGEMALIDDKPRSATVETITPARLAFIGKDAFQSLVETRSELAFHLTGYICLSLFRRILRLDRLYSEIKQKIRAA